MGFGWIICVAGCVDWFAAADSVVFPLGHTDFSVGEPGCCSDCILYPRRRACFSPGDAAIPLDRGHFQQCELDSGHISYRYRRSFRANSRWPFLRRPAELERKILSQNDSTGSGIRRRGSLAHSWQQLVV